MDEETTPTINLVEMFNEGGLGSFMKDEIWKLQKELNHTPKWRKIKRYRLLEKLYKLEEDYGLMDHVFNDR